MQTKALGNEYSERIKIKGSDNVVNDGSLDGNIYCETKSLTKI